MLPGSIPIKIFFKQQLLGATIHLAALELK
jgi:hypothetical protein